MKYKKLFCIKKIYIRILLSSAIIFTIILASGANSPASAHELAKSGSITSVMHIEPDDSPAQGKESQIIFFLSDSTNKLALNNCKCYVDILQYKTNIKELKLIQDPQYPNQTVGYVNYDFPINGQYSIYLHAQSIDKRFNSFNIVYTNIVNIGEDTNIFSGINKYTIYHLSHILALLLPNIIFILLVIYDKLKNRFQTNFTLT